MEIEKIMREILPVFLIAALIMVAGCAYHSNIPEKPIGKAYLDLCITDPLRAEYWQKTGEVLRDTPENRDAVDARAIVTGIPACDNVSVTIWEYQGIEGGNWNRVTVQTKDGGSNNGWLLSDHLHHITNETGTEWSENYSSIVGSWDQAGRGNGARIWYDFKPEGTFTFNYDMRGNKDNMRDTGSWTYLGNNTWDLITSVSADHDHTYISLDPEGKSFKSGFVYSSQVNFTRTVDSPDSGTAYSFDPAGTRELVYCRV
jgi:hypothetical protein